MIALKNLSGIEMPFRSAFVSTFSTIDRTIFHSQTKQFSIDSSKLNESFCNSFRDEVLYTILLICLFRIDFSFFLRSLLLFVVCAHSGSRRTL